jgi:hypothetical protein
MGNENNGKKPFYKRWWFIALAVLFIIGTIGNIVDPESNETAKTESSSTTSKPKITLDKSTITTDADGVAIITGRTSADASVTAGITHTTKANSRGKFKVSYDLSSPETKTVNITVTKGGTTATDSVIIKPATKFRDEESSTAPSKTSSSKASSSAASSSSDKPATLNSNASIKQYLKKNTNVKILEVNGYYAAEAGQSTVQVTIQGSENLTKKMTVQSMYMDISSIWKAFRKTDMSNFSNIGISVKYPLQDDGGNETNEYVIKSGITPEKLSQLNVTNFMFKNVPTFATSWWQHPALTRALE